MKKLTINVISETEFTVKGHGVHTAYLEMVNSLKAVPEADVRVNSSKRSDVVHLHTFGGYALKHLLFDKAKKVVTAHVVPGSWIGSIKFARVWAPLGARYLRFFYNKADLVLAVSEEVKGILQTEVGVTAPIEVMHNSVDTSRYRRTAIRRETARKALKITKDTFVVVGSGQIQPRKRFDLFVDMAKRLPDALFVWVGGMPFKQLGDDYANIQQVIKNAPANLRVTGVVDLEDVRQYYHAADIFFFPSVQETFGLVVVEAAAAGLPVLLRDIPDYDHTFKNDVLRGDDASFERTICRLRDDKAFYRAAHEKSLALARRFDSKATAQRLVELYRKLLA